MLFFCYLLSTAYFTCCLFCFWFCSFLIFHFPPLGEIFAFQYIFAFLWLSVDPRIFTKHLFVVPYEINCSLLIATTKHEHLFLKKVKVELNASEETHWNVCAGKVVMPARVVLIYNFIVLLTFVIINSIFCVLKALFLFPFIFVRFFYVFLQSCAIFKTDIT